MQKTLLLLIVTTCSLLLFTESASACDCLGGSQRKTFDRAKKSATVIFVGRAIEVTNGDSTGGFRGWQVKFKVKQYWKGLVSEEMVVYTSAGDCASYFEVGKEYLVLALKPEGKQYLDTNICMETAEVRDSADHLLKLGKGKMLNGQVSLLQRTRSITTDCSGLAAQRRSHA